MSKLTVADFNDEQLVHKLYESERSLVAAKFKHSLNQLENTSELTVLRKNIARLRTEARRRELEQCLKKDDLLGTFAKTFAGSDVNDVEDAEQGGFLQGIVDKLSSND